MTNKRQLALPLPRARAGRPLKRALRDWNEDEFLRALARHGVTCTSMDVDVGLFFVDRAGRTFEAVVRRNPLRIARRATLAKILRGGGGVDGNEKVHRVESREGQESNRQNRGQLNG